LLEGYNWSTEGVLRNSRTLPGELVVRMPEKFTIEQNEQTVIESFIATNIAELCRRHSVSVCTVPQVEGTVPGRCMERHWRIVKGKRIPEGDK